MEPYSLGSGRCDRRAAFAGEDKPYQRCGLLYRAGFGNVLAGMVLQGACSAYIRILTAVLLVQDPLQDHQSECLYGLLGRQERGLRSWRLHVVSETQRHLETVRMHPYDIFPAGHQHDQNYPFLPGDSVRCRCKSRQVLLRQPFTMKICSAYNNL